MRRLAVVTAILGAVVFAILPGVAVGDTDLPPLTGNDEVTLLPGGSHMAAVISNDSDDQDDLALCRVRSTSDVETSKVGDRVFVFVSTDQPGDYQIPYQACDYDYLSVGTLTVHAVAPKRIEVTPVAGQPGAFSATNPNPVRVRFGWAGRHAEKADGWTGIRANSSATFTVHRHHVEWIAIDPSSMWEDGSIVDGGRLTVSTLPPASSARDFASALQKDATGRSWWSRLPHAATPRSAGRPEVDDWPPDPTTVEPPEPRTDTIHWWSGSWDDVPVLKNDMDPQGDSLSVCRLAPDAVAPAVRSKAHPSVVNGHLLLGTRPHATGTLLVPYYVCNSGRLASSTLRVILRQAEPLTVDAVAGHPHQARFHNPNVTGVQVWVGPSSYGGERIGRVPEYGTRTLRVPRGDHFWWGTIGPHEGYAGVGKLPGS